ncbi:MAG TPA: RecQ family ATP-dependent DNA helicase [Ilumatobacter sp.]|nr:RecQ family ATP-dependent DNA helicase [Ilumatobacter sp.]
MAHTMAVETTDPLLGALQRLTGRAEAEFRDGQREAITALVDDRARVLVVQRTGWGKSAVYFLTTHLLRAQGLGPTLLISPLLALMRNQIEAAERLGLRCMTINTSTKTTVRELVAALEANDVDLLLISPERLANPEFAQQIMPLVRERPGLIVIDEAHCISDWGHDFRPDYRRIRGVVERMAGSGVPVLGCTATANDRVVADVAAQLGAELTVFRGPLRREGLALSSIRIDRQAERLVWLTTVIPQLAGSGIVYCLTVRDTEIVADWLSRHDISAIAYHSDLDTDAKIAAEDQLLRNDIKVLVATVALGMGYDKPDLGFVIHYQSPGSPVGYYQQVGRAGRALPTSVGVLLRGLEDEQIQNYFIERAFAEERLVQDVIAEFDDAANSHDPQVSLIRLQVKLNVRKGVLDAVVRQLEVDGALLRISAQVYQRTNEPWAYPTVRVDEVTAARRAEQQAMTDYLTSTNCRMQFLAGLLDDPHAAACGICDNCTGVNAAVELAVEAVAEAEVFLRKRPLIIKPRKRCYDFVADKGTAIPAGEQSEEGRALAILGDGGWGQLVRDGRQAGQFDDRLIDALADMIRVWQHDLPFQWVTAVPSLRTPRLVASVAERLAALLGLPFAPVVSRVADRPPQKTQANAFHLERNVAGAFRVAKPPAGAVLLIDDLFDSGWTLTEVGRVLRRAGSGRVYPVVLASSLGRD